MTIANGSDAATNTRATPWPYVIAIVALIAEILYLVIWGRRYGLDLKVYRDSVTSWRSGRDLYFGTFTRSRLAFTYPPFALVALSPLTWASFPVTQWLLWAASIIAATGSVLLILRDRGSNVTARLWCKSFAWSCVAVMGLEPARSGIDYGQIEFILMFIVVADLLVTPSRYRGVALGVAAAVKLTPLVFVIVLVVSRDLKSTIRALVSFVSWTTLSWLLWPGLSRLYWFHDVSHPARVGTIAYAGNQSWYAVLHRPPFSASGFAFLWLLLSLVTLAAGTFVAWRCVGANQKAFAIVSIALVGLLVVPTSWTHHWIWVMLIPPMIVGRRSADLSQSVQVMLWGLIVITIAAPYWWFSRGIPADALAALLPLWAAAVLVVWGCQWIRDSKRRSRTGLAARSMSPV